MKELYGKKNDSIETPKDLLAELDRVFSFNFDPCPLVRPDWDGLKVDWGSSNFVNPPFSEIEKWLEKGIAEKKKGKRCVFLLTARTNTLYWHKHIFPECDALFFLERGLKFEGYKLAFPVPMVLAVFDQKMNKKKNKKKKEHVSFGKYRFFRVF